MHFLDTFLTLIWHFYCTFSIFSWYSLGTFLALLKHFLCIFRTFSRHFLIIESPQSPVKHSRRVVARELLFCYTISDYLYFFIYKSSFQSIPAKTEYKGLLYFCLIYACDVHIVRLTHFPDFLVKLYHPTRFKPLNGLLREAFSPIFPSDKIFLFISSEKLFYRV
jgi:hypothetical protein